MKAAPKPRAGMNDEQLAKFAETQIQITPEVTMSVGEAARWSLLIDAIDVIDKAYEERGLDFDEMLLTKKAKPHKAVTKFINERYVAELNDIKFESRV